MTEISDRPDMILMNAATNPAKFHCAQLHQHGAGARGRSSSRARKGSDHRGASQVRHLVRVLCRSGLVCNSPTHTLSRGPLQPKHIHESPPVEVCARFLPVRPLGFDLRSTVAAVSHPFHCFTPSDCIDARIHLYSACPTCGVPAAPKDPTKNAFLTGIVDEYRRLYASFSGA